MIECRNISAGYGREKIIEGIDLNIVCGEVLAIVGPNGCGKTTLLRTLSGILKPMEGEILYEGKNIADMTEQEIARKAAFLTQNRETPVISVERLVLHGRFPWLGMPRRYRTEDVMIAQRAMAKMGCEEYKDKLVSALSGGQRQKVYLAMVLAQDTKTVFMDEPTTYLDIQNQLQVLQIAGNMVREGKAVVMVLHDLAQAMKYADRIAVIKDGGLVCCDTPDRIYGSGILDTVFDVKFRKVETSEGIQYYSIAK